MLPEVSLLFTENLRASCFSPRCSHTKLQCQVTKTKSSGLSLNCFADFSSVITNFDKIGPNRKTTLRVQNKLKTSFQFF